MHEVRFNGYTATSCATDNDGVITATIDVEKIDDDSPLVTHDVCPGQTFDSMEEAEKIARERLAEVKDISDTGQLVF